MGDETRQTHWRGFTELRDVLGPKEHTRSYRHTYYLCFALLGEPAVLETVMESLPLSEPSLI